MMKISKPVLMNDFMVSHVQFTSLNLVNFKNIKPVYDGNEKILLEYEYPSKIELSSRDWIGIFPRGWSTLQQYVTFEWISQSIPAPCIDLNKENGDVIRRTIAFCPKYHMNCVNQSAFYQFVYVGKQIEVLGVSSYFRFDLTCVNDTSLEIECLVPVTGKIRSTSVSDFGTISMTNEQSTTSIDSRKLIHTSSIHSLQNLDIDSKLNWSRMNFTDDKKNLCLMKRTVTTPSGTGDNLDPYSSHSEPVFPMSLPLTQCRKCLQFKRGGEFLRSQQVLQSKVGPRSEEGSAYIQPVRTIGNQSSPQDKLKIVMERNKILEERAQEMKKELERLQTESKRMKMSFYNINKEKVAYEKFVKDFIKSLEKDSIVRVMYGNTEILVKKVNYVGMEEHPRYKKTSKRERELKAVIGLQEITIRNLINSLQEKAKSVEELNQTVKLAQVFSAARNDSRDLGMDAEESADDISNSDLTSEYEFSLSKPTPPEEVSADTDEVLDTIRRTSEMELKNIGITRSLGKNSEADLDVSNLSIMTYDAEKAVTKKSQLVDNVEDCWPFPINSSKTLRQKLSEEKINLHEQKTEYDSNIPVEDSNIEKTESEDREDDSDEAEEDKDSDFEIDPSNCEDYYDAYDGFSVRSFSPEPETYVMSTPTNETRTESDNATIVAEPADVREIEEKEEVGFREEVEETNLVKYTPPEKFNKFTCELSIDFGQRRPLPDGEVCVQEHSRSEQNLVACRQSEALIECNEQKVYSLERERSLITFTKSNKCLEIKITQMDQKEPPQRGCFHQKMIVQFAGNPQEKTEEKKDTAVEAICDEPGSLVPVERTESSDSKFSSCIAKDSPRKENDEEVEVREDEEENVEDVVRTEEEEEEEDKEKEEEEEEEEGSTVEIDSKQIRDVMDTFSPRTEWNDANEDLENDVPISGRYPESPIPVADPNGEVTPETEVIKEKMMMQLEEKKDEITQQFLKSKCNIQMMTEDSINNLKMYQDSLRYEKNLQFLNNKTNEEGNSQESDEEVLKEKPSAILIQNGQAKLALIRFQ